MKWRTGMPSTVNVGICAYPQWGQTADGVHAGAGERESDVHNWQDSLSQRHRGMLSVRQLITIDYTVKTGLVVERTNR